MKVGFVSLGCNKNLVDSEKMIALFKKHNYEIVNNPEEAEIIVINTCGFIQSAKEEAISTILEMAEYKNNNCKYLIATGCLVERYKEELEKELPEVDLYIKYKEYDEFWDKIEYLINKKHSDNIDIDNLQERVITTGETYAYLKIADGCSNCCTYCAIPKIRGPFKSRKIENILKEANMLVEKGYKEIIVTAQDTTKYGVDIYGKPMLDKLLEELCKIEEIKTIRFLYSYPETITDELIEVIKNNPKICNYLDIPIQHINDNVLKRMNRSTNGTSIRNLIKKLRLNIPDIILRTTVMVGFPGETEEEFNELYEFLKEAKFDKLGAFMYSKEEGTAAEKMPNQINGNTKKRRYNKIMKLQQKISKENLQKQIGKTHKVMIEGITTDLKYYVGRSYMDAPEIDGNIFIKNKLGDETNIKLGDFVKVKIDDIKDYDLIGSFANND